MIGKLNGDALDVLFRTRKEKVAIILSPYGLVDICLPSPAELLFYAALGGAKESVHKREGMVGSDGQH